jgi:hypothetical protein
MNSEISKAKEVQVLKDRAEALEVTISFLPVLAPRVAQVHRAKKSKAKKNNILREDSVLEEEKQLKVLPCEELHSRSSQNTGTSCPICQNGWNTFPSSSYATVLDCGHAICLGDLCQILKASEKV